MKKNILLNRIASFSLLIISSPTMSMLQNTPKKYQGRKTPTTTTTATTSTTTTTTATTSTTTTSTTAPTTLTTTLNPITTSLSTSTDLEESRIITQVPTTRGFGLWRSAWDFIIPEEENLFSDLQNKKFDIKNSSYHRKLSTAIETFVNKKNDGRLTETFEICRSDYRNILKIEDTPALMAHIFLVEQNKYKQETLKAKLEEADKNAITETNRALALLKTTFEKQMNEMSQQLLLHNEAQDKEIEVECNEIRRLKKGLGNIHKLNRTFNKPDEEYCSDDETQDPEEVTHFYSNAHILEKIIIDKKLMETKKKIQTMLAKLATLNNEIQSIQELLY